MWLKAKKNKTFFSSWCFRKPLFQPRTEALHFGYCLFKAPHDKFRDFYTRWTCGSLKISTRYISTSSIITLNPFLKHRKAEYPPLTWKKKIKFQIWADMWLHKQPKYTPTFGPIFCERLLQVALLFLSGYYHIHKMSIETWLIECNVILKNVTCTVTLELYCYI